MEDDGGADPDIPDGPGPAVEADDPGALVVTAAPAADGGRRGRRRDLGCALGGVLGVGGLGVALVAVLGLLTLSIGVEGCEWGGFEIGPGDGTDSRRVRVDVAPTTGLDDGTTVFVTSEAFEARSVVGITQCLAEAATEEQGIAACDEAVGQRLAVGDDGVLRAAYAVTRVITVDGEAHDCASSAERCILVAAWRGDYDLSGGRPLTFADGLPPVDTVPSDGRPVSVYLPGELDPAGPVAASTTVRASASGFVPGERVLVALCSSDVLTGSPLTTCVPVDPEVANVLELYATGTADADDEGRASLPVRVPDRLALGDGTVRCADEPGRCGVVVAATADLQRSAYLGLTVTR